MYYEKYSCGRYIRRSSPVQNTVNPTIPKHKLKWKLVSPQGHLWSPLK